MSADDDISAKDTERTVATQPSSASGAADDPNPVSGKFEAWLESLLAIAGLIVAIGIIAGFVVAFQSKVTPCENGHEFPSGTTDFTCYAHPHAIVGGTLIGASVFAGLVLAIIGVSAKLILAEVGAGSLSSRP